MALPSGPRAATSASQPPAPDDRLTLSVYNDGPRSDGIKRSGIGMSNMRTRLQGLYGNAFELTMQNQTLAEWK